MSMQASAKEVSPTSSLPHHNRPFPYPAGGSPPQDIPTQHETAKEQSLDNSVVLSFKSNNEFPGINKQTVQSGGVLESPEGVPDVSKATDSPAAGAATATAAGLLTDEVKSKIDHPQDLGDQLDGHALSLTAEQQDPEQSLVVKLRHKSAPLKYLDKRKSKSLSDLSSCSDSDRRSNWSQLSSSPPHLKGPGVGEEPVILQSSASLLAHRESIDKDKLHVCKSQEWRVTICKDKLTKSISASHSWESKNVLDVFKKGDVAYNFYLHPNMGAQMQKAELRVLVKVSKSLFKKIKGYFQKCWIIVESEVLDHQAGKELGFKVLRTQWIDPTKDGTVNFNHDLVLCEPLSKSSSQNVDVVTKVIFAAQKPEIDHTLEEYEGDFLFVKTENPTV